MFNNPDINHLCIYMINLSLYKNFQNHSVEILLMKRSSYMYCHIHKELNLWYSQMTLLPKIEVLYKDEGINLVVKSLLCLCSNLSSQAILRIGCLKKK